MRVPTLDKFLSADLLRNDRGEKLQRTPLLDAMIRAYDAEATTRGICCVRRQGKSTGAAFLAAYELLFVPYAYVVWVSGSSDQIEAIFSQKLGNPLRAAAERHELRLSIARDRAENLETGAIVECIPPTAGTSVGRSVSLLILDECRAIPEEVAEVLRPAAAEGRIVCVGTAGRPGTWWHRLIRSPAEDEHVVEFSDVVRPEVQGFMESERKRTLKLGDLGKQMFEREWRNVWLTLSGAMLLSHDDIERASRDEVPAYEEGEDTVFVAADLSLVRDLTSILALALRRDGTLRVLETIVMNPRSMGGQIPLQVVEDRIERLAEKYSPRRIVIDRFQAVSMAQSLRAKGIPIEDVAVTAQLNVEAFELLAEKVTGGLLTWKRNERLEQELLGLEIQETASSWRVVDKDRRYHRDLSFSLALAVRAAFEVGPWAPQGHRKSEAERKRDFWEQGYEEDDLDYPGRRRGLQEEFDRAAGGSPGKWGGYS